MQKKRTSTEACARALALHHKTFGRAADPTNAEIDRAEKAAQIAYATTPTSWGEVVGFADAFLQIETPDGVVRLFVETIRTAATRIARAG